MQPKAGSLILALVLVFGCASRPVVRGATDPEEGPPTRRLGGKVLRNGQADRGARVLLERRRQGDQTVLAGPDGAFVFTQLQPGRVVLRASSSLACSSEEVAIGAKDLLAVDLRLQPCGETAGVVRDTSGAPVADAVVSQRQASVEFSVRTKKDGRYRLPAAQAGDYSVSVTAGGYLQGTKDIQVVEGVVGTADFVLTPASPLAGVVVDEAGLPIAEAQIECWSFNSLPPVSSRRDGSFSIDHLAPGTYELEVMTRAFGDFRTTLTAPTTNARLVLSRGLELTGVVVDENDRPIERAKVIAFSNDRETASPLHWAKSAFTNSNGEFRITGLRLGNHSVSASLGPARRSSDGVVIKGPGTAPITLKMAPAMAIAGKVVGRDGRPAAGRQISAFRQAGGMYDPPVVVETGPDGTFRAGELDPGKYFLTLDVDRERNREANAGDTGISIVIDTSKVRGRLLHESGKPVTRFTVLGKLHHDPDGAFEIPLSKLDTPVLVFSADGMAQARRFIGFTSGRDVELGDIVLSKGRTVTGRVLDARTGEPVVGAWIRLEAPALQQSFRGPRREEGILVTGADGSFSLPQVESSPVAFLAAHEGYCDAWRTLESSASEVTLLARQCASVKGQVRDAAGKPVSSTLSITGGGLGQMLYAAGSFHFEKVPPGPQTLWARVSGASYAPRQVEVPESGEVEVDFAPATGGVHLRVTTPPHLEALLLPGVRPVPSSTDELVAAVSPRREEGGWGFANLQPGTYTLLLVRVASEWVDVSRRTLEVTAEPEQRVTLQTPERFDTSLRW